MLMPKSYSHVVSLNSRNAKDIMNDESQVNCMTNSIIKPINFQDFKAHKFIEAMVITDRDFPIRRATKDHNLVIAVMLWYKTRL